MRLIVIGKRINGVWTIKTSLWRYVAAVATDGGSKRAD